MSETKKLGEDLASNPHSRRLRESNQATPEFNTGAKKLSEPALYTLIRQPRQVLVEPAALVSIERWILLAGGGDAVN